MGKVIKQMTEMALTHFVLKFFSAMRIIVYSIFPIFLGVSTSAIGEEYKSIRLGGFSPDGNRLLLTYCTDKPVCKFGYYDFRKQKFVSIEPKDVNQVWSPGGFSPDGSRVAIAIRKKSENERLSQVGILDVNTLLVSEITNSQGYKSGLSFSHDGKKIIFSQSIRERRAGKTRYSDWDIYEVDVGGGLERKLTEFGFFSVTPPYYLPGDNSFVFSGDVPYGAVSDSVLIRRDEYRMRYKENQIFLLSFGIKNRLGPMFVNGDYSSFPTVSADGKRVVYSARTDKLDAVKTRFTYDLFLFDGKSHSRLSRLDSLIGDIVLSFDGGIVAFVEQPHKDFGVRLLKVLNIKSGVIELFSPERFGF